jgi:hypothetical protein
MAFESQVTSLGWRVRSCAPRRTLRLMRCLAREWRSGLQSYDIDRFGIIVSTTEDGLHADQS